MNADQVVCSTTWLLTQGILVLAQEQPKEFAQWLQGKKDKIAKSPSWSLVTVSSCKG